MPLYNTSHHLDLRRLEVGQVYELAPYKWIKVLQLIGRDIEKRNIYKVVEARDPSKLPATLPE